MRPIFVARFQGLFNQQASEARAVDEQIAFYALATGQHHSIYVAIAGPL